MFFCQDILIIYFAYFFFFQAEDGIRDLVRSRGLGDVYKRQTLTHPELIENPIVSVSYDEVKKFAEKAHNNYDALSASFLSGNVNRKAEKDVIIKAVNQVHKVFDQKALMAGSGLLLKIMRQFESSFATKYFYLVKNGQVGWVSAYVDQTISQ